ncbi:DUF1579 domain-containing protein [Planctomycetota bacterium]|jgi:hypothetical protein|nr:DUF1579 domain-containing protein [Planctomycetota bacterium]
MSVKQLIIAGLLVPLATLTAAATLSGAVVQDDADAGGMQMPQPTEEHERMLAGAGLWKGVMKATYPGMPPMSSAVTETVEALGPFHTLTDFRAEFMGVPYHGHGIMGFDEAKGEAFGTWSDNMSPHTSFMRGTVKSEGDTTTIEMRYEAPTPMGEMVPHRNVGVHTGDTYKMTFYMGEGDEEVQTMTLDLKRAK